LNRRINLEKVCCFTGHRPDKLPDKKTGYDESNPTIQYVKIKLQYEIECAIEQDYRRFIFGGALGVDTFAGEIVADLAEIYWKEYGIKLYLELYSPFEGQEGNWPDESKIRYYNLMARCDKVVTVCDAGYAAWKMIVRDKAMVNVSELVIAVYNGDKGRSGTGHTVDYAVKKGRQMVIIDPRDWNEGVVV
jgi:uncharacterized phage-like protein YoqJ